MQTLVVYLTVNYRLPISFRLAKLPFPLPRLKKTYMYNIFNLRTLNYQLYTSYLLFSQFPQQDLEQLSVINSIERRRRRRRDLFCTAVYSLAAATLAQATNGNILNRLQVV